MTGKSATEVTELRAMTFLEMLESRGVKAWLNDDGSLHLQAKGGVLGDDNLQPDRILVHFIHTNFHAIVAELQARDWPKPQTMGPGVVQ
jgi:hypothetical protein